MVNKIPFSQQVVSSGQQTVKKTPVANIGTDKISFQNILQQQLELKFSAHAQQRLEAGKINLKPEEIKQINEAVEKVKAKGGKESLVLFNNLALIVSVKNKTVITAVEDSRLKENVFTNIDSAIIV